VGRAMGLIQAHSAEKTGFTLRQTPALESLGAMLDCARNAVPRVERVKRLLRILSRMGYRALQLYMEDVFILEDYPYFGYGRQGYTDAEMSALDDYAAALGIELVPAVQTLAHLKQTLKWDAMRDYVDVDDILLLDEEKTGRLIEAIFAKMRRCFRTEKINIGMDEAHMLGLGKYLQKHGFTDRTQLLLRHFERVHCLANRYGFRPMLWSDMFFRLAAGGEYYRADCAVDPSVGEKLPGDTALIYWDYYSFDSAHYDAMLNAHLQITPNIVFAASARKANSYVPCNHFSIECARHAFPACVAQGIRQVLVTLWGDNGAECSLFGVLPTLHDRWPWESKPAGMDVLELRLGGMRQRFLTARERLESYLAGRTETIEEMDTKLLPFSTLAAEQGHCDVPAPFWHRNVSPASVADI